MELYYLLGGIGVALILAAVLAIILKKRKNARSGRQGEKKVARILRNFAMLRGFKVINGLYLPLYDKTTEIDHILIGYFGMIVIETKNCHGEVYGDEKQDQWTHLVGKSKTKHTLYNPVKQNQTHIDCIRHIFVKEQIYKVNIENLVVFTGKKLQLNVGRSMPIIQVRQLKKYLHKSKYAEDKGIDVDKIYDTLMRYRVTDPKLLRQHNKNVWEIEQGKLK